MPWRWAQCKTLIIFFFFPSFFHVKVVSREHRMQLTSVSLDRVEKLETNTSLTICFLWCALLHYRNRQSSSHTWFLQAAGAHGSKGGSSISSFNFLSRKEKNVKGVNYFHSLLVTEFVKWKLFFLSPMLLRPWKMCIDFSKVKNFTTEIFLWFLKVLLNNTLLYIMVVLTYVNA